jgi:hypothetical protein
MPLIVPSRHLGLGRRYARNHVTAEGVRAASAYPDMSRSSLSKLSVQPSR